MDKLTFKEYLASKEKLVEALKNTPVRRAEHELRKYCKLPVSESDEKRYIPLKPKNKVIVEWHYQDINNPTLMGISFPDIDEVDASESFLPSWPKERFKKWLLRNTKEL